MNRVFSIVKFSLLNSVILVLFQVFLYLEIIKNIPPEKYALYTLIASAFLIFDPLKEYGATEFHIQKDKLIDNDLGMNLSLNIMLGFGLMFASWFMFAGFYQDLLHGYQTEFFLISSLIVISSCSSTKRILATNNLDVTKILLHDTVPLIASGICMFVFLQYGYDLYALIIGLFFRIVSGSFISYLLFGLTISKKVKKNYLVDMLSFGKWYWLSAIIFVLNSRLDKIVLVTFLNLDELGEYILAFSIVSSTFGNFFKYLSRFILSLIKNHGIMQLWKKLIFFLIIVSVFSIIVVICVANYIESIGLGSWSNLEYLLPILTITIILNFLRFDAFLVISGLVKYKLIVDALQVLLFYTLLYSLEVTNGVQVAYVAAFSSLLSLLVFYVLLLKSRAS